MLFPILTLMDERLRTRGSRDPLGFQKVWSDEGRKLIPNLTTVTSNLNNFISAIICFNYANKDVNASGVERIKSLQDRFKKMEQLLGYARESTRESALDGVMGISRVRDNFNGSIGDALYLGGRQHEILSNQIVYGMWGYYSAAMEQAGLLTITSSKRELTEDALEIVSGFDSNFIKVLEGYCDQGKVQKSALKEQEEDIKALFENNEVNNSLIKALLMANSPKYGDLFTITKEYFYEKDHKNDAKNFLEWLKETSSNQPLSSIASNIIQLEKVLSVATWLFEYLRVNDGKNLDHIVVELKDLTFNSQLVYEGNNRFLSSFVLQFNNRNLSGMISELLDYHKKVMQGRSGAPWVEIIDGKIKVRTPGTNDGLPKKDGWQEIMERWSNPYFVPSYLSIYRVQIDA